MEDNSIIKPMNIITCPKCLINFNWFDLDNAYSDTDLEIIKTKEELQIRVKDNSKYDKIIKIKQEFYKK